LSARAPQETFKGKVERTVQQHQPAWAALPLENYVVNLRPPSLARCINASTRGELASPTHRIRPDWSSRASWTITMPLTAGGKAFDHHTERLPLEARPGLL